jgi:hypothetical protein
MSAVGAKAVESNKYHSADSFRPYGAVHPELLKNPPAKAGGWQTFAATEL